jgi:hypothetical protein
MGTGIDDWDLVVADVGDYILKTAVSPHACREQH